jgi:hypothetical protein
MALLNASTARRAAWGATLALWLLFPRSVPAGQPSPYPSATVCAKCHTETYESWSRTFHALSAIDPVFIKSLERAEVGADRETRKLCLMCHSPTTNLSGDFDLASPVSREGVTCSFCHSVTLVDHLAGKERFVNDPSRLAIEGAARIEDHHFEDHSIVLNAEFCAGCHEWVNANGLRILSTYSEWKASVLAAEGIPCQKCHMPMSLGGSVTTEGSKSIRSSNLHFQMGGHSQAQLVSAARLDVTAQVEGAEIILDVGVTNAKAGHMLPTGIPNRKMKLLVDLYDRDGELLDRHTQVFSRVIADKRGKILEDVTDQFLHGARELVDNRIAPKETRKKRIVFDRPPGKDFFLVEASLQYDIFTPYLVPPIINFTIVTRRLPLTLADEKSGAAVPLTLAILVTVFLLVTVAMGALFFGRRGGNRTGERKE